MNVATAIWAVADHASFAERVAPFGPLNGHLIDDYAAASGTFGAALLVAAVRAAWRVPLIAVTALWTALHAVSHIAAADDVGAGATGPVEAVALVAATVVLIGMLVVAEHDP